MSDDREPEVLRPDYLLPGQRVGEYEIVNKLGKGGFGTAYKVTRDGRELAMKVLLTNETSSGRSSQRDRIKREFGLLQLIGHPNIVKVHAFEVMGDLERGYPYIVMDLVDGREVYEWQFRAKPSLRQICASTRKIADALVHMHDKGLYHRDIKSENILVKADGEPILIDFGIARTKAARTLTRADTLIGTLSHFSPEYCSWTSSDGYARGESYPYYPQGDFYALGYLLYELCTGREPFELRLKDKGEAAAEDELIEAIKDQDPLSPSEANPHLPPVMEEILLSMLSKRPHERLVGRDLINQLNDAVLEDGPAWEGPFEVPLRDEAFSSRRAAPSPRSGGRANSNVPAQASASLEIPRAAGRSASTKPVGVGGGATPRSTSRAEAPPPGEPRSTSNRTRSERSSPAPNPGPSAFHLTEEGPAPAFKSPVDDISHERPTDPHVGAIDIPTGLRAIAPSNASGSRRFNPLLLALGTLGGLLVAVLVAKNLVSKPAPAGINLTHELDDARASELAQNSITLSPRGSRLPPAAVVPTSAPTPAGPVTQPPVAIDVSAVATPAKNLAAPGPSLSAAAPPPPAPVAVAPSTLAAPSLAAPAVAAAPAPISPVSRRSSADQADVDQILTKSYGRPTLPPKPAAKAAPAEVVSPFAVVTTLGGTKVASSDAKGLGVGTGRRIHVRLKTPLDSKTIGDGPVEFQVTSAVSVNGEVVIPALSLGYGHASTNGGRFTLSANLLKLPSGTEIPFTGIAYDRKDGKPGLPAGRQVTPAQSQGDSLPTKVAKTTANTALTAVSGGIGQDVARNAASTVVNSDDPSQPGSQAQLLLDAPYEFELMVTKPF